MKGPEFLGKNGYVWWIGIVEDNNDPVNLGRCKVRIFGWHDTDINKLPTSVLPWAQQKLPTIGSGYGGIGISPTEVKIGSWVGGFFLDGDRGQFPVFDGIYPGLHTQGPQIYSGNPANPRYKGPAGGKLKYDKSGKPSINSENLTGASSSSGNSDSGSGGDLGANVAVGKAPTSGSRTQLRKYILGFFMGKGYTKEQAAGITGNLEHESGRFNKKYIQSNKGDGGRSYGIAQWLNKGRARTLKKKYPNCYWTLDCQLDFVYWESTHTEKNADKCLKKITDKGEQAVRKAAIVFALNFERPRGTRSRKGCNAGTPHGLSDRVRYSIWAYRGK